MRGNVLRHHETHRAPALSGAKSGSSRFVYVAAALSALGGVLFGYDTGVISSAIIFLKRDFSLSSGTEEFVVSAVLIGAVIGAAIGGRLADRYGRRLIIIAAAIVFTLGALGTAFAETLALLDVGRIVVGIAIGIASFVSPLYISEVSPVDERGKLVSLNQLAVTAGIIASYLVGYALSGSGSWRWMFGLAALPSTVLAVGMYFMPESPRWLFTRHDDALAERILRRIRGTNNVSKEVNEIRNGLSRQSSTWHELVRPVIRPALIVGVGLAVFQQITGINTVIYYAPTILQFAGFHSASSAILATVGVGIVNMVMTIVALFLVDRVGRRPLLLIGVAGMVLSLAALGVSFGEPRLAHVLGPVAMASLMVYVGAFAVGLGPVFWLLISEIYPLKVRGLAMSVATLANWGANLAIALTFLTLIGSLGKAGTFYLYAAVSVGAWIFTWFLVPETKGRTLEQIEAHWHAGGKPSELR